MWKIALLSILFSNVVGEYILSAQGQNCWDACYDIGQNCNPVINTNNSIEIFRSLGANCVPDTQPWWAEDQPGYVTGREDPNYGKCVGFIDVPSAVHCSSYFKTSRRLCRCDKPKPKKFFSTGCAGCPVGPQENTYFAYTLANNGDHGVLNHMWTTYDHTTDAGMILRYYVDGEKTPSITFTPSLGSGVGFFDQTAPWGNEWIGKGSNDGGWFNNFRVPFQKSLRVTAQHMDSIQGFYIILRGAVNMPITVGGTLLPKTAKLNQFVTDNMFSPLAFVTLAHVTSGPGAFWMHSIQVDSGDLNFLEGCYHVYTDGDNDWPGTLLSTGTEDYFDSAWYFNAGEFRLPVSGFTHLSNNNGRVQWSAYRFHDQDPLFFDDGFKLDWRNGDVLDKAGIKCLAFNGSVVGTPTNSNVKAYAWVYTW